MGKNTVGQSNCSILEMEYFKKEAINEVYFSHVDKNESFPKVNVITFGVLSQSCPKCSK